MRILYCAVDQQVPDTKGGGVHVLSVASGLARRGHEVHVATGTSGGPRPQAGITWHDVVAPLGRPQLRLLVAGRLRALAKAVAPDIVIERYHNFGGEGILAARACRVPVVLEVNAPIVDYPNSAKQRLDHLLMFEPLRRWREWLCRQAALIVTPTRAIVPSTIDARRVLELEWGADVQRFTPEATGTVPYTRLAGESVAVFAGAFRSWHGAHLLIEALQRLDAQGCGHFRGVFIGDGPELARVKTLAGTMPRVVFTGAIPHEQMPAALAGADVGVAPFDVAAHPPLSLAFYWSPLKVFEYMAAGLAVVAPSIDRLARLIENGHEGVLYDPPDAGALAAAITKAAQPVERARLGAAARARVVRDFSWDAHCARLEQGLAASVGVGARCAS